MEVLLVNLKHKNGAQVVAFISGVCANGGLVLLYGRWVIGRAVCLLTAGTNSGVSKTAAFPRPQRSANVSSRGTTLRLSGRILLLRIRPSRWFGEYVVEVPH